MSNHEDYSEESKSLADMKSMKKAFKKAQAKVVKQSLAKKTGSTYIKTGDNGEEPRKKRGRPPKDNEKDSSDKNFEKGKVCSIKLIPVLRHRRYHVTCHVMIMLGITDMMSVTSETFASNKTETHSFNKQIR